MSVWRTSVMGATYKDIQEAAEAAARDFFEGSAIAPSIEYWIDGNPIDVSASGGPYTMLQTSFMADVEIRW